MDANAPAASDTPSGFFARPHPSFDRRGVRGKQLEVHCHGSTLDVRGQDGARLEIPARNVARLRLGVTGSRSGTYYLARVLTEGEAEPLFLCTAHSGGPGYAGTMRRFARAVAEAHGVERIEHGTTRGDALFLFLATLVVAGGATILAFTVWADEGGAVFSWAFAAAMAALVAAMGWHSLRHADPKPLKSLDELERTLPRR